MSLKGQEGDTWNGISLTDLSPLTSRHHLGGTAQNKSNRQPDASRFAASPERLPSPPPHSCLVLAALFPVPPTLCAARRFLPRGPAHRPPLGRGGWANWRADVAPARCPPPPSATRNATREGRGVAMAAGGRNANAFFFLWFSILGRLRFAVVVPVKQSLSNALDVGRVAFLRCVAALPPMRGCFSPSSSSASCHCPGICLLSFLDEDR